jgi:uncharacterized protein YuzE
MRQAAIPLRVTYDRGAGYIYLTREDERGASAHQVLLDGECGYAGRDTIVLDFDRDWRLIGVEVLDADRSLPESLVRPVKRA